MVSLEYFGESAESASEVVISFILEEDAEPQEQKLKSESDTREDETVQSTLVKIIERAEAATVTEVDGVSIIQPE